MFDEEGNPLGRTTYLKGTTFMVIGERPGLPGYQRFRALLDGKVAQFSGATTASARFEPIDP